MKQPLDGKKVLITRKKTQAKQFSTYIREVGGKPIEAPLITITCKQLLSKQREHVQSEKYSWVFFTSTNGVECFFSQQLDFKKIFKTAKIAVVGSKTAEALNNFGFEADFIPPMYDAETMIDVLLKEHEYTEKWLLVRGNLSKMTIPHACERYDIPYDMAVVYNTENKEPSEGQLKHILDAHQFDFITFTSPSTVDSFYARTKEYMYKNIYKNTIIICIGKTTKARAIKVGFNRVFSARPYTIEGMVQKMIDIEKERKM